MPGNTKLNLRVQINAITLSSGKELPRVQQKKEEMEESIDEAHKEEVSKDNEKPEEVSREMIKSKDEKKPLDTYIPRVPYHEMLKGANSNSNHSKFIKVLKSLHVNIPFIHAIILVPFYARFLKEIITRKRKMEKNEVVALPKGCSPSSEQVATKTKRSRKFLHFLQYR